jgi:hypothetical protein
VRARHAGRRSLRLRLLVELGSGHHLTRQSAVATRFVSMLRSGPLLLLLCVSYAKAQPSVLQCRAFMVTATPLRGLLHSSCHMSHVRTCWDWPCSGSCSNCCSVHHAFYAAHCSCALRITRVLGSRR